MKHILLATVICVLGINADAQLDRSYFNSNFLLTFDSVTCNLEGGGTTTCYELTFAANPDPDDGPFCPNSINDVGGFGNYDGATNPGFQVFDSTLLNAMENDGYDIVDGSGFVYIDDFTTMGNPAYAYCLQAAKDDDLKLTFQIPKTPQMAASPNTIDEVELMAVSLNGVPTNGTPPSVVANNGNIPALDQCGGHHDPAGYYHWHFIANSTNTSVTNFGITGTNCSDFTQDDDELFGFAMDGYPVYGATHGGVAPTGLDACNGHTSATDEFPGGVYHYHAVDNGAPNLPPCLMGKVVAGMDKFTTAFFDASTLGVEEDNFGNKVLVSPNPVNGQSINIAIQTNLVELVDAQAKRVWTLGTNVQANTSLDVSNIENGTYFLLLHTDKRVYNEKVVILH